MDGIPGMAEGQEEDIRERARQVREAAEQRSPSRGSTVPEIGQDLSGNGGVRPTSRSAGNKTGKNSRQSGELRGDAARYQQPISEFTQTSRGHRASEDENSESGERLAESTESSQKTGEPEVKEPQRRIWQVLKRSAYNEDGSLWFPTRLTASWLADQKSELKPYLFASQYLNEYISSEDRRFRPEWIRYKPFYLEYIEGRIHLVEEFDRDFRFHHLRPVNVFTAVDPAISDRKYADYTGISTVAVDQFLNYYVLESRRVRGGVDAVLPEIIAEIRLWSSGLLIIETNAFQKAYKKWLDLKLEEERIAIAIKEVKSGVGTGKDARIENMTTPFANMKVWIRRGVAPHLEHELLNWRPKQDSGHDDLIDSLAFAFENGFPATFGQLVPNDSNWHDMDPKEREKIRNRRDRLMADMERSVDRQVGRVGNFSTGWDAPPKTKSPEPTRDNAHRFFEAWTKSEEEQDKAARKPAGA